MAAKTTATFDDGSTITYGGTRSVTACWRVTRHWNDGEVLTGFSMTRELAEKRAEQLAADCYKPKRLARRRDHGLAYRRHKAAQWVSRWGTCDIRELREIADRLTIEARSNTAVEVVGIN